MIVSYSSHSKLIQYTPKNNKEGQLKKKKKTHINNFKEEWFFLALISMFLWFCFVFNFQLSFEYGVFWPLLHTQIYTIQTEKIPTYTDSLPVSILLIIRCKTWEILHGMDITWREKSSKMKEKKKALGKYFALAKV